MENSGAPDFISSISDGIGSQEIPTTVTNEDRFNDAYENHNYEPLPEVTIEDVLGLWPLRVPNKDRSLASNPEQMATQAAPIVEINSLSRRQTRSRKCKDGILDNDGSLWQDPNDFNIKPKGKKRKLNEEKVKKDSTQKTSSQVKNSKRPTKKRKNRKKLKTQIQDPCNPLDEEVKSPEKTQSLITSDKNSEIIDDPRSTTQKGISITNLSAMRSSSSIETPLNLTFQPKKLTKILQFEKNANISGNEGENSSINNDVQTLTLENSGQEELFPEDVANAEYSNSNHCHTNQSSNEQIAVYPQVVQQEDLPKVALLLNLVEREQEEYEESEGEEENLLSTGDDLSEREDDVTESPDSSRDKQNNENLSKNDTAKQNEEYLSSSEEQEETLNLNSKALNHIKKYRAFVPEHLDGKSAQEHPYFVTNDIRRLGSLVKNCDTAIEFLNDNIHKGVAILAMKEFKEECTKKINSAVRYVRRHQEKINTKLDGLVEDFGVLQEKYDKEVDAGNEEFILTVMKPYEDLAVNTKEYNLEEKSKILREKINQFNMEKKNLEKEKIAFLQEKKEFSRTKHLNQAEAASSSCNLRTDQGFLQNIPPVSSFEIGNPTSHNVSKKIIGISHQAACSSSNFETVSDQGLQLNIPSLYISQRVIPESHNIPTKNIENGQRERKRLNPEIFEKYKEETLTETNGLATVETPNDRTWILCFLCKSAISGHSNAKTHLKTVHSFLDPKCPKMEECKLKKGFLYQGKFSEHWRSRHLGSEPLLKYF